MFLVRQLIFISIVCLVDSESIEPIDYTKLWKIEGSLIENMNAYANLMQQKIDLIKLALSRLHLDHNKQLEDPEIFLSNPLNSFALMRRMHLDWPKYHEYLKEPLFVLDKINSLDSLLKELPNAKDFRRTQKDFHQLQKAFRLKEIDMAKGFLNGKQYNGKLSVPDCFELGKFLNEEKLYDKALLWFQVALKIYKESHSKVYEILGVTFADVWFQIADKSAELSKLTEAKEAINRALELRPDEQKFIVFKKILMEVIDYKRLCREGKMPRGKHLHCRYNGTKHPFLKIGPFKTEEVSLDPYMVIFYDYVNDKEIKELKEISLPLMKRGFVGEEKYKVRLPFHYGSLNDSKHDLVKRLSQRNAAITGLSLEYAELIVISYGLGGNQYSHYDHRDDTQDRLPPTAAGSRHVVVSIYLQDIEGSGSLIFPQLNMAIPSKKGIALVFPILNNEGRGEKGTQHGSCPIVFGSKWTIVQAFATNAQMFKLPCYKRKN